MMPPIPVANGSVGFGQTFATSTYGTTVTAHASADTQGTIVELVSATAFDAHWIEVMVTKGSAAGTFATNIYIGAATEQAIITGLVFRCRSTSQGGGRWLFPIFIPKGSRLAASVQSGNGGTTCLVAVSLFNGGMGSEGLPGKVEQYGTLIVNSDGVNVDPGGTANTDSAWVEMTAATLRNHNWLTLSAHNRDHAIAVAQTWLIDIGIGSATEQVLVSDLLTSISTNIDMLRPDLVFHCPIFIPKGSRLTVRARCSVNTDSDRDLYVVLHGA